MGAKVARLIRKFLSLLVSSQKLNKSFFSNIFASVSLRAGDINIPHDLTLQQTARLRAVTRPPCAPLLLLRDAVSAICTLSCTNRDAIDRSAALRRLRESRRCAVADDRSGVSGRRLYNAYSYRRPSAAPPVIFDERPSAGSACAAPQLEQIDSDRFIY
ncbi:hypothetical protein EVAR_43796_1 [Eumeta japonica]|uniref:Uncharacterized protein n=1 Tax=Eumeta variegata TaxID=151549 RepID=A0A4C1XYJ8_EUMVA|nr:hypothetical protein EVAR_43796_1 [Eumeta japonica]